MSKKKNQIVEKPDKNFVVCRDDLINYMAEISPQVDSPQIEEFRMMALNIVLDTILFAKNNAYDKRKKS
jgi:hypothetical protein